MNQWGVGAALSIYSLAAAQDVAPRREGETERGREGERERETERGRERDRDRERERDTERGREREREREPTAKSFTRQCSTMVKGHL